MFHNLQMWQEPTQFKCAVFIWWIHRFEAQVNKHRLFCLEPNSKAGQEGEARIIEAITFSRQASQSLASQYLFRNLTFKILVCDREMNHLIFKEEWQFTSNSESTCKSHNGQWTYYFSTSVHIKMCSMLLKKTYKHVLCVLKFQEISAHPLCVLFDVGKEKMLKRKFLILDLFSASLTSSFTNDCSCRCTFLDDQLEKAEICLWDA